MKSSKEGITRSRTALLRRSAPAAALGLGMAGAIFAATPASTARFQVAKSSNAGVGELKPTIATPAPSAIDEFAPLPATALKLTVRLEADDTIEALLDRAGVAKRDISTVARLVGEAAAGGVAGGTDVALFLGQTPARDYQRLERMSFEAGPAMKFVIGRDSTSQLRLIREYIASDATPLRFRGRVKDGLFWSLRSAGVSPEIAHEYLRALGTRSNVLGDLSPDDMFDLVVDHHRTADGRNWSGPLLFAAVERPGGGGLRLVRWSIDGRTEWLEPGKGRQRLEGFDQPVSGSVSSNFGYRIHPILRIARLHQGVDFRAASGTPVVASADGTIVHSGWSGGYGRQVAISHGGGTTSSYSHLSGIAVASGTFVRRGEVIGFVGSSGFSTGPHLHYEVREFGRPVDPLKVRHATIANIAPSDLAALGARVRQLRAI